MLEKVPDGRRKVDVAVAAVVEFARGLRLENRKDRASVISFNQQATELQPLTSSLAELESALGRLAIAQQSRLDLGVSAATDQMVATGRQHHTRAMVILSDGLANPVPGQVAVQASQIARAHGVEVFVVGMGPSLDETVLRSLATEPSYYYAAADPLLVHAIYRDLTSKVPCPVDLYWSRR